MEPYNSIYEHVSLRQGEDEDGVDDEWCAMVTEAYRDGKYRAIVQATHFYARDYGTCNKRAKSKGYEKVELSDEHRDGLVVDGRILGARMLPILKTRKNGSHYWQNVPYAILTDVSVVAMNAAEDDQRLTSNADEPLLVPLTHIGDSLMLYAA